LKELNIRGCSLCSLGGEASFLSLANTVMTKTSVSVFNIGDERRLSESGWLELSELIRRTSTLATIVLDVTAIGISESVAQLLGCAVGESSALVSLSMCESRMTDAVLAMLCQGLKSSGRCKYLSLDLGINDFSLSEPLHEFIFGSSSIRLQFLSLAGCRLATDSQVKLAGRIACSPWISKIDLQGCGLSPLFSSTLCTRLSLQWSRRLSHDSKTDCQPCVGASALRFVNLSDNSLGQTAVARLFELLTTHAHSLRVLQLKRCLPGEQGVAACKRFLASNTQLVYLTLSRSEFTLELQQQPVFKVSLPLEYTLAFLCSLRRIGAKARLNEDTVRYILGFLEVVVPFRLLLD